ncbi:MAG: hypothetical protein QM630_02820 [Microbacterium sp.]
MAYDDIDIPIESMLELEKAVKDTIAEFESARTNSDALANAIGSPLGRSDLRAQAERFESAWDDKRTTLKGHLEDLLERVSGTRQSWEDLDRELQASLEPAEGNKQR